jgi:hypothetical protein
MWQGGRRRAIFSRQQTTMPGKRSRSSTTEEASDGVEPQAPAPDGPAQTVDLAPLVAGLDPLDVVGHLVVLYPAVEAAVAARAALRLPPLAAASDAFHAQCTAVFPALLSLADAATPVHIPVDPARDDESAVIADTDALHVLFAAAHHLRHVSLAVATPAGLSFPDYCALRARDEPHPYSQ